MKRISNAFSFNMLDLKLPYLINVLPMTAEEAADFVDDNTDSSIGYESAASLVSAILGKTVAENRKSITLRWEDELLVAQYTGERLPAGATSLPEGATLEFALARIYPFNKDKDQAIWRFEWDSYYGGLTGIFLATDEDVKELYGKTIYFGEIQGKHSDISLEMKEEYFTKITDHPWTISIFEAYQLSTGENPVERYKEERDEEWGDEEWEDEDDN